MGYLALQALQVLALASTQRKKSRMQKVPNVDGHSGTLCFGVSTYIHTPQRLSFTKSTPGIVGTHVTCSLNEFSQPQF